MSPHVGNFVHDLVEMAKAMERVPGLESEIARLQGMVDNYAQQVQAIELRAIDRNTEIEQLNAKIRSLEVERDDASFRALEQEDLVYTALCEIDSMQSILGKLKFKLDPPKPEPKVAAQPIHLGDQEGQSVMDPTPATHMETSGSGTVSDGGLTPIDPHQTEAPGSVSEGPTVSTTEQNESPPVPSVGNTDTAPITTSLDPEPNEPWTNEWYAWKDRQAKP